MQVNLTKLNSHLSVSLQHSSLNDIFSSIQGKVSLVLCLLIFNIFYVENTISQAQTVAAPAVSPYCAANVPHFGGDAGSNILLTIKNTGPNSMEVRASSANTDPVDLLLVPSASGATISGSSNPMPGEYLITLTWTTPPTNVSMNVLWSKASFGGNWQLSQADITIPFAAVCGTPPPTTPVVAAPTPTCPSNKVISMFSNGYTNVPVDTWRTSWSGAGALTDLQIAGNDTKKYDDVDFVGIETVANQINISNMKYFHIDVWSPNFTEFRIKLVDFGPNGMFQGGDDKEHEITFTTPAQGTWISYQIPLSAFTGLTTKNNFAQLILVARPVNPAIAELFIDNVYFSTCDIPSQYCNTNVRHLGIPAEVNSEVKLSIGNSGENSITVEIESATASPVDYLQIDGAAGAVISDTKEIAPGKLQKILRYPTAPPANVTLNVLWSKADFGGNWQLSPGNITIPFIAVCPTILPVPTAPTTPAPAPSSACPSSQVISLFSNSFPNVNVNTFLTPWSQAPVSLTNLQIAGNDTKLYKDVTFLGIETTSNPVNASAMNTFHISFWSANATQFRIKLVDLGPDGTFAAPNPEHEITFNNPKLGEWVTYEIPLSSFTGLTSRSNLAQYILSAMPNGQADFYMDNMYFSSCGLPSGWTESGVNCGSDFAYNPTTQVYTGNSNNCYGTNPFNNDEHAMAQYSLCGDGSITAQVTSITPLAKGWAGVIMRESNVTGAKKAQLMTNLSAFSRREFRTVTGAVSYPQQFPSQNRYWLRITRTGTQFTMFVSPNGINWFQVGSQTITMGSCINVGLVMTNYSDNSSVTATFGNVSVTGGQIPARPTVNQQNDIFGAKDFKLTPNPAYGFTEIDLSAYSKTQVQLDIFSLQGNMLKSITIDEGAGNEQLDLSGFNSGMYLIRAKAEGFPEVTKRLIISN